VKHENHLPEGAFKVRGGVAAMSELRGRGVTHVVAAARGDHGVPARVCKEDPLTGRAPEEHRPTMARDRPFGAGARSGEPDLP
jgi:hypothetical protein